MGNSNLPSLSEILTSVSNLHNPNIPDTEILNPATAHVLIQAMIDATIDE